MTFHNDIHGRPITVLTKPMLQTMLSKDDNFGGINDDGDSRDKTEDSLPKKRVKFKL